MSSCKLIWNIHLPWVKWHRLQSYGIKERGERHSVSKWNLRVERAAPCDQQCPFPLECVFPLSLSYSPGLTFSSTQLRWPTNGAAKGDQRVARVIRAECDEKCSHLPRALSIKSKRQLGAGGWRAPGLMRQTTRSFFTPALTCTRTTGVWTTGGGKSSESSKWRFALSNLLPQGQLALAVN